MVCRCVAAMLIMLCPKRVVPLLAGHQCALAPCSRVPPVAMAITDLTQLTVYELKAVCRAKGLKVSGRKAELVARISAAPAGVSIDARTRGRTRSASDKRAGRTSKVQKGPHRAAAMDTSRSFTDVVTPPVAATAASTLKSKRPAHEPPNEISASPFAERLATEVDTEVLGKEEAEAEEDLQRRRTRRAARRARLSQYFEEEYTEIVSQLELTAGSQFAQLFGGTGSTAAVIDDTEATAIGTANPLPPSVTSDDAMVRYREEAQRSGRRLAWCRQFDAVTGIGELIDLEERSAWPIDRTALKVASVPQAQAKLYAGEFVEYIRPGAAPTAVGGDGHAEIGQTRVMGILGWPLMCEAIASASPRST